MNAALLRDIRADDASAIAAIYGHWVLNGTGTFEEIVPSVSEMTARIAVIGKSTMPWIVAQNSEGAIMGYAYASPFRPRTGYRHTVEDSVYVAPQFQGRGLGKTMLQALIPRVEAMGVRQMLAVIGDSANQNSIKLHESLGFTHTGVFRDVGFKFGRWLDVCLMQLSLGSGAKTLPQPGEGWRQP